MAELSEKERKAIAARAEARRDYFAYLDKRMPELQRSGFPGRLARREADREYAAQR